MADNPTPICVTLVVPIITAVATWITAKFDVLSINRVKEYGASGTRIILILTPRRFRKRFGISRS
jgi:hypothetical protein